MIETLAESHVLAEKSGLGTEVFHHFISNFFRMHFHRLIGMSESSSAGPYTAYSNRMLSGDYYTREEASHSHLRCLTPVSLTATLCD